MLECVGVRESVEVGVCLVERGAGKLQEFKYVVDRRAWCFLM